MNCGLCHKEERGADPNKDYLCGSCVVQMMGMNRDQKRTFIDSLYLKGQDQEAQFLEKIFEGGVTKAKEEKTKPVLLKRRII